MIRRRAAAFLAAALLASPGFAEDAKPTPQPVTSEPQTTTASYGDWILRCQRLADPAANKLCEISLTLQAGQQPTPIAQVALGRLGKTDPYHLTAHLPTNISLPSVVKFSFASAKDGRAYELAWRRCVPAGCFADSALTDAQWKDLRGQTEPESLEFVDAVGRPVKLPVSVRGLAQAMDALIKE